MTITAKYASQCASCGATVRPGEKIEWSKGAPVRHTTCGQTSSATSSTSSRTTGEPPLENEDMRRQPRRRKYGSHYTRFSSGAEVFSNRAGRCEDAPCCGCCS